MVETTLNPAMCKFILGFGLNVSDAHQRIMSFIERNLVKGSAASHLAPLP